jgi:glycine cleavage system transcriptional repressor
MSLFAVLTLFGHDRPGIVARVSHALLETGCNIEDSSMTRLQHAFTIMMILRLPHTDARNALEQRLADVAQEMGLTYLLQPGNAEIGPHPTSSTSTGNDAVMINLLGADKPGIVYQVTRFLADHDLNVTNLHTSVIGTATQPSSPPIYVMSIEVEHVPDYGVFAAALAGLARTVGVEITSRPYSLDPL